MGILDPELSQTSLQYAYRQCSNINTCNKQNDTTSRQSHCVLDVHV